MNYNAQTTTSTPDYEAPNTTKRASIGLLSTKEAMKAWGISRYALRKLVDDGVIHPILTGSRNWKFDPNDYYEIIRLCKCK